ncbi:MAG TPA: phosphodiester glycosidase family protein [Gemmatimonadaceae bacterium]|nr:phosphodiester glycosidase family protein [Gemmatimonadaceae bacterium]
MSNIRGLSAVAVLLVLAACAGRAGESVPAIAYTPDTARVRVIAPGVIHRYLWDRNGPWAIHVIEARLGGECSLELRTAKANDRIVGRETTSNLAREFARKTGRPMVAMINADFFLFDPPGVPTGTQVIAGELVSAGPRWPVVGTARVKGRLQPFISSDSLLGQLSAGPDRLILIRLVNRRPDSARVAAYNPYYGPMTPSDNGVVEVAVDYSPSAERIGEVSRGVVTTVDSSRPGIPIGGRNRIVFAARNEKARIALEKMRPGDSVTFSFSYPGAPGPVVEMVGGFPLLVSPGQADLPKRWADRPASFIGRNPRTAIGWRADGTVLLVTVDGRRPGYSMGMTLDEMVDLSRKLGAREMLNLDGGGSTAMVIDHRLVNKPTDKEGERAVANAIGIAASRNCPIKRI